MPAKPTSPDTSMTVFSEIIDPVAKVPTQVRKKANAPTMGEIKISNIQPKN